jgi:hypothetical protein
MVQGPKASQLDDDPVAVHESLVIKDKADRFPVIIHLLGREKASLPKAQLTHDIV